MYHSCAAVTVRGRFWTLKSFYAMTKPDFVCGLGLQPNCIVMVLFVRAKQLLPYRIQKSWIQICMSDRMGESSAFTTRARRRHAQPVPALRLHVSGGRLLHTAIGGAVAWLGRARSPHSPASLASLWRSKCTYHWADRLFLESRLVGTRRSAVRPPAMSTTYWRSYCNELRSPAAASCCGRC